MLRAKFQRLVVLEVPQDTVSVLAHIPQPMLSLIENGRVQPSPAQLERLAKALRVSPPEALLQHISEPR